MGTVISMGLFGRRTPAGITITADELYQAIHETLVKEVPSLAPTLTPYGVMLLYLPKAALMLNLSGKHWTIGVLDTENYPQMSTRKTIKTPFEAQQAGELIVSVLEECERTYARALDDALLTSKPELREWFTERQTEVAAALAAGG